VGRGIGEIGLTLFVGCGTTFPRVTAAAVPVVFGAPWVLGVGRRWIGLSRCGDGVSPHPEDTGRVCREGEVPWASARGYEGGGGRELLIADC